MTIQLIFPCFASPFTPSSLSTTKVGLSDAHCRKTVEGTYIDILTSVRTQDDTPNVIERQLSETKRLSHGCTLSIPTTSTTVCESGKCVCELTVSANVCVWEKERWSQTEPCKFPLAITLRRVMLRSTQSASQKILTHSFYEWDSMYARYTHSQSENSLQWCNTITQSSRSTCNECSMSWIRTLWHVPFCISKCSHLEIPWEMHIIGKCREIHWLQMSHTKWCVTF